MSEIRYVAPIVKQPETEEMQTDWADEMRDTATAAAKKSEHADIVRMATEATVAALAPTLALLAKGQADIVEGLNAETEQIAVRDANQRIEKTIKRRVRKAGVQIIPETKLPKGTGPTVAS